MPTFRLFLTLLLCLSLTPAAAQKEDRPPRVPFSKIFSPQQFQREQESFIIKETGITPLEAAKFFPVFQNAQSQLREINGRARRCIRTIQKKEVTEKEAKKLIDELKSLNMQRAKLENKYYEEAEQILGPEKAIKVISAKEKFDRRIFHKMVKKRP